MDKSNLEVETLAFSNAPQDMLRMLAAAEVTVHTIPSRRKEPIRYMAALHKLVKERSYDAVHVNGNSGTVALELLCCLGTSTRTRIVHSRNTKGEHNVLDALLRPTMNRLATHRLACGRDAGKWLFGDREFTVVPNGRDFSEYAFSDGVRTTVRRELGLSTDDIAVGHVGNFTEQKNHRFLIDAFAEAHTLNPRLKLFLIGDGPLRREMEQRSYDRCINGQIRFIGRSARVAAYLNAFDVAVLPSLYEGFPNVVIEWQVNGLPGLVSSTVTDECAVTDLVQVLPASDVEAWALQLAASAPTERNDASAAAQYALRAAGYEAHDSAVKLRALYMDIKS